MNHRWAALIQILILATLAGCRDGHVPQPTAPKPTPEAGAAEPTRARQSPVPIEHGVVVDAAEEAAATREALATLRAQEPSVLRAGAPLEAFYEQRQYRPVLVREGRLGKGGVEIIDAVRALTEHGLTTEDYDLDGLARSIEAGTSDAFHLEVRVLDTWLSAATRLLAGSVDPVSVHAEWNSPPRQRDLVHALAEASSFEQALFAQAPAQPGYARLREALATYRRLAEEPSWPKLELGAPLAAGATGTKVVALRTRLRALGDLEAPADGVFDSDAIAALRSFQSRHGLADTGSLDAPTVHALNVSPAMRAEQLAANLERWRWLPEDLGDTHVRVNIAAFTVEAWRAGKRELVMNAVVGKPYRRTPVFSDSISHIVLNPRWSVPIKLATKDVLPKIKKDPGFLKKNGFRVFRADTGAEVAAGDVPWNELGVRKFGYILRQEPGADNALGRLKIMFPNPHDVYLHDTPKRHLFKETKRAFSSGCVRLEDPRSLAVFVLDDERWTRQRIDKAIANGREQTLWLGEPVPVHLQYWTAWVDDAGTVHFREDLYGRDARLISALRETPPR